jgi:hypothetical protein
MLAMELCFVLSNDSGSGSLQPDPLPESSEVHRFLVVLKASSKYLLTPSDRKYARRGRQSMSAGVDLSLSGQGEIEGIESLAKVSRARST